MHSAIFCHSIHPNSLMVSLIAGFHAIHTEAVATTRIHTDQPVTEIV